MVQWYTSPACAGGDKDLPSVVGEVLGHMEIHRHVVTVVGVAPLALHHSHHTSLHMMINVEQSEI